MIQVTGSSEILGWRLTSHLRDGTPATASCWTVVKETGKPNYEIRLQAGKQKAVVDVDSPSALQRQSYQALKAFVLAADARLEERHHAQRGH